MDMRLWPLPSPSWLALSPQVWKIPDVPLTTCLGMEKNLVPTLALLLMRRSLGTRTPSLCLPLITEDPKRISSCRHWGPKEEL